MAFFESHPDRMTLDEGRIVNSWFAVIPQAAGRGEKFLDEVERTLTAFEIPNITIQRKELETMREGQRRITKIVRPSTGLYPRPRQTY